MDKTIFLTTKDYSTMSTKYLVLELFKKDTTAVYKNQQHIADSIYKYFSVKRKQAAVSKALKKIYNKNINYKGVDFYILKLEDGYKLYKKGDVMDEATQSFADKKVFVNYDVYIINKNILAFTVKEQHHQHVKDYMTKAFDAESFFDIISHEDKMYFLLHTKENLFNDVCELPKKVKEIEEINKKTKEIASFGS